MQTHVRILVFLLFIMIGINVNAEKSKIPEYEKYVNEVVNDFERSMKKQYKLHCYGSGGSMPNDVEKIEVLFISYGKTSIEDVRKVEVRAIQELLHRINTHEKIRPYLREYPFGANRVNVSISFRTKTDDYPLDGSVALVFLARDKIFYKAAELQMSESDSLTYTNEKGEVITKIIPGEVEEELIPLMEEPYEEALKIVNQTQK